MSCPRNIPNTPGNTAIQQNQWGLTLPYHGKVPSLCVEAFPTTVFLIDPHPTPVLGMETPFKLLHGKDLDTPIYISI